MAPASHTPADESLLREWVEERDEQALQHLVERYGPLVQSTCRRCLGEGTDADDAAQATFIALTQHAPSIHDASRLSTWLHRTAMRACLRLRRADQRRRRHERAMSPPAAAAEPLPEQDWSQARPHLDAALESLPLAERATLLSYIIDGTSQGDLARQDGVSREALKKRIQRSLLRLQDWYRRRGITAETSMLLLGARQDLAGSMAQTKTLLLAVHSPHGASTQVTGLVSYLNRGPLLLKVLAQAWAASTLLAMGMGLAIAEHRWGMHAPKQRLPADTYHAFLFNFWSMAVMIGAFAWEEGTSWWRTRESHWAPIFLLVLNTSLSCLLFWQWVISGPGGLRLKQVEFSYLGLIHFSLYSLLLLVVAVGYLVAGASWIMERTRNRKAIPWSTTWIRVFLLLALCVQGWAGFMDWILSTGTPI